MLTGDNPLTACHVAKELRIATRKTLVLTETNEEAWLWQSIGGGTTAAMETLPRQLGKTFDLCLTGQVSSNSITQLLFACLFVFVYFSVCVEPYLFLYSVGDGVCIES